MPGGAAMLLLLCVGYTCEAQDVVTGYTGGPVTLGEGTEFWSDRTYVLANVPPYLVGGLLYQFPVRNYDAFSVSVNVVPTHVYILYDNSGGRAGGLDTFLQSNGWEMVCPAGFGWGASSPVCYGVKTVSIPTSFSFPSTVDERLMGVAIKQDADAVSVQPSSMQCVRQGIEVGRLLRGRGSWQRCWLGSGQSCRCTSMQAPQVRNLGLELGGNSVFADQTPARLRRLAGGGRVMDGGVAH